MNLFFIAYKLGKTLDEINASMDVQEYVQWLAFFDLMNDDEVYSLKHKGKKRPKGWYAN